MTKEKLLKAIKLKCLECSGGVREEVQFCQIPACPLYPYRLGEDQALLPGLGDAEDSKDAGKREERRGG
ncbi:MAG: hypothetical protein HDQ93_04035 [Desulfovibrio sp.]|nr:hypothetical protein [Desulfovibrio sp.]